MKFMRVITMLSAAGLSVACGERGADSTPGAGSPAPSVLTAESLGEQHVVSNAEHLVSEEFASADTAWGERLAMQCRACHALEAGGADMIGPALHGFFGKPAGSRAGFAYSPALSGTGFVWTPRALDAWLAQPADFLPGNRMIYAGLSKADDRRAVIAYLLSATDDDAVNQP